MHAGIDAVCLRRLHCCVLLAHFSYTRLIGMVCWPFSEPPQTGPVPRSSGGRRVLREAAQGDAAEEVQQPHSEPDRRLLEGSRGGGFFSA